MVEKQFQDGDTVWYQQDLFDMPVKAVYVDKGTVKYRGICTIKILDNPPTEVMKIKVYETRLKALQALDSILNRLVPVKKDAMLLSIDSWVKYAKTQRKVKEELDNV